MTTYAKIAHETCTGLRSRQWCIGVAGLLAFALAGCGPKAGAPDGTAADEASATTQTDPDTRIAIVLPVQGRHMVLTEMRGMLTSVQAYINAAARDDTAGMRAAAEASGMVAAQDMNPAMEQRLPPEFLQLGMATHAAWDSLALDVSHGAPTNQTLGRLGTIMNNCVACHTQFRIDLER